MENLKARILTLEKVARQLEPAPDARHEVISAAVTYAHRFLDAIEELPAYVSNESAGADITSRPISESPAPIASLLDFLAAQVDRPGINPASGGHLGYIPGGGIYYGAVGDYLAAVTNRYAGVFFASPGAVRMENMLLRWIADSVGYPPGAGGNLASGGSIANLTAIVAARDDADLSAAEIPKAVVYMTPQVHHCIDKALRIAGLREAPRRMIPVDERFRMRCDRLADQVASDRRAGLRPWLIIASAGTTDTGAIDPLEEIAGIARQNDLWFHIDGAYGAFFALCEAGRQRLAGMSRSDSLILDPHKTLFLSYGSGAVLVRDVNTLLRSQHYEANYMQDAAAVRDELAPADLSPELSRHFRGLRLWLPLQLHGVAPFRAALAEKLLLAQYFWEEVQKIPFIEAGPPPDLSVVIFRYVPPDGDADAFNRRLVAAIQADGRVFMSSTIIDGHFIIRMAAVAFRTHMATIDLALDIIRDQIARLQTTAPQ